jgi:hypothetical protein
MKKGVLALVMEFSRSLVISVSCFSLWLCGEAVVVQLPSS